MSGMGESALEGASEQDATSSRHVSQIVAALLATAAVVYAAWVGELILAWGDLDPVTSYVSELSATGESASGLWRAVDALAGTLVALASFLALRRGRERVATVGPGRWRRRRGRPVADSSPDAATATPTTATPTTATPATFSAPSASAAGPSAVATSRLSPWPAIGWWALLVFGVATVFDAANPLSCAATADAACAAREAIGDVPLSHRIHTYTSSIAGAALLLAVVVLTRVGAAERIPAAPFLVLAAGDTCPGRCGPSPRSRRWRRGPRSSASPNGSSSSPDRPGSWGGACRACARRDSARRAPECDRMSHPLEVVITGSPAGPPVLLCPGLGMAAASWHRVAADLARDHAVITYDRPGLGRQGHLRPAGPPNLRIELTRLAHAIDAWRAVAADPAQPVVLVGHSMASFWVEAFARLHPDVVRGIVLVDGSIEEAPRPPTPGATTLLTWLGGTIAAVPGLLRTAGAALLEDAAYLGMAADLHAVRAWNPLPHVPIVVLAATRTGATHWERRWLRCQEEGAARFDAELDAEQPGESDVRFEVVRRSGHRVMRDAPESITRPSEVSTRGARSTHEGQTRARSTQAAQCGRRAARRLCPICGTRISGNGRIGFEI